MIHRNISRRAVLQGALLGGGLATFGAGNLVRLAEAQDNPDVPDQYYVFCYFGGGWDVLLSLDPRDPRQFNNANMLETRIQPGYELQGAGDRDIIEAGGLQFGPYIGDLVRHVDRMAVVRGMSMDTLGHATGKRRFLTGKPPSGLQARGSSGATWLASRLGRHHDIPNLAVRVESYNKDQPNYATALSVNSVRDLLRALRRTPSALPPLGHRQVQAALAEAASCPDARNSRFRSTAHDSQRKAQQIADGRLAELFDFGADTPAMADYRAEFGIVNIYQGTPELSAGIAVRALVSGVSRCVSVTMSGGLDHHGSEWAQDQGPRQRRSFNAIAKMADVLAETPYGATGNSWLDHTTIVAFSEFSRTPLLNAGGGRDHWLNNACLLLGGNVRGGQVIGASSDIGMQPQKVDLATGLVSPEGEVIRPEHILTTLYRDVGIGDEADLRVDPLETLLRG
jgi:uncharacterized protein (DUF1501 family)